MSEYKILKEKCKINNASVVNISNCLSFLLQKNTLSRFIEFSQTGQMFIVAR